MSFHNGIDIAQWRAQVSTPLAAAGPLGHPSKVAPLAGFGALPPSLTLLPAKVRPAHAKPVALPVTAAAASGEDDDNCCSTSTTDDGGLPSLAAGGSSDDSSSAGPTSPSEAEAEDDAAQIAAATTAAAGLATVLPLPPVETPVPVKVAPCARDEREAKKLEADRLVDSTLELLNAIWHHPSSPAAESGSAEGGVSLRTFVNEILRRSRSSCATLRAARWYLERASGLLPVERAAEREGSLACPRRTFLSALVLANKFLHDRVYSNKAWGKVSGLETTEISLGELALGSLLDWALWVRDEPVATAAPAPVEPSPSTTMAEDDAAPPLVPLKSKRSFQPKRPLGPGRNDRSFRSTLGAYAPAPHVPAISGGAPQPHQQQQQQQQPAKRRFSASKSFSPSTSGSSSGSGGATVAKRARVVGASAVDEEQQEQPMSGVEDALVASWETRMNALLAV